MRRGIAGLILGLALVVASVSWAGFIMTRTVLDPGRSERLADQLFENEELRSVLANRLAQSVSGTLPGSVIVPSAELRQAADLALDNEAVQTLVRDGIVATHRSALEGNVQPVVVDGEALGTALRSSLVGLDPELAETLPPAPAVSVELPVSGLNILGTVRTFVERTTMLTAAAALIGALVAIVITSDRPSVLRRVAFWAFGAAAFWLFVGFAIPWVASTIGPASAAIVTAAIDVFFGAMIRPAIIMGMVGGVLLASSYFWRALSLRRPANVAQPERAARGVGHKARVGQMSNIRPLARDDLLEDAVPLNPRPVDATVVQPSPLTQPEPTASPGPGVHAVPPTGLPGQWAQPGGASSPPINSTPISSTPAQPSPATPTQTPAHAPATSTAQPAAADDPWLAATGPASPTAAPAPETRWVEGVGYVEVEPEEPPTDTPTDLGRPPHQPPA